MMAASAERAVHNLIYRYAELFDEGDFQGVGALFARGSLSFAPGDISLRGSDAVASFYERNVRIDPDSATPKTVHRVYNTIVIPAGAVWQARSRYDVLQYDNKAGVKVIACGRYFDTFEVHDQGCVFKTRRIIADYLGDTRDHLNDELGIASYGLARESVFSHPQSHSQ